MADPGQVVQEQKSMQGKELTISNNSSAFHLSSPWDQAISAMKKGLAICVAAASKCFPGEGGWVLWPLCTTGEKTQGQRGKDWPGCHPTQ